MLPPLSGPGLDTWAGAGDAAWAEALLPSGPFLLLVPRTVLSLAFGAHVICGLGQHALLR